MKLQANFIKKRLQHKCFPVKFEKNLRTILKIIRERLLLYKNSNSENIRKTLFHISAMGVFSIPL